MSDKGHPQLLAELRRPFTPAAVRFKPQTWNIERKTGIAICYIDARLVVERLNRVAGLDWHDEYELLQAQTMLCRLTVAGTTRQDVGVTETSAAGGLKALYSDALKRAGVRFGVGVSLYAVPQMQLHENDLWFKRDGKPGGLKDQGQFRLRGIYERWLDARGREAFGEPLDHGDVDDSVGEDTPSEHEPAPSAVATNGHSLTPVRVPEQPAEPSPGGLTPHEIVSEGLAALTSDERKRLKAHLERMRIAPEDKRVKQGWLDAIVDNFSGDYGCRPLYEQLPILLAALDEQHALANQ
jgi:hypothetical protein